MLKKVLFAVGLAALAAAIVFTGVSYAQGGNPNPQPFGQGMMGGGYGRGNGPGPGGMGNGNYGVMHDAMFDALASGLGITREDLDSRVAGGETPLEIALSLGFTEDEFVQIHTAARTTAINDLLADGTITQEQADWMLNHTPGNGYGPGNCPHLNGASGTAGQ